MLTPLRLKNIVIRRVGGLEVTVRQAAYVLNVIRRVGGLEGGSDGEAMKYGVIRRVGGLEGAHQGYGAGH